MKKTLFVFMLFYTASTFAQKQIDATGVLDELIGPRRIAGKENLLFLVKNFQPERNIVDLVRHPEGKDFDVFDDLRRCRS